MGGGREGGEGGGGREGGEGGGGGRGRGGGGEGGREAGFTSLPERKIGNTESTIIIYNTPRGRVRWYHYHLDTFLVLSSR